MGPAEKRDDGSLSITFDDFDEGSLLRGVLNWGLRNRPRRDDDDEITARLRRVQDSVVGDPHDLVSEVHFEAADLPHLIELIKERAADLADRATPAWVELSGKMIEDFQRESIELQVQAVGLEIPESPGDMTV